MAFSTTLISPPALQVLIDGNTMAFELRDPEAPETSPDGEGRGDLGRRKPPTKPRLPPVEAEVEAPLTALGLSDAFLDASWCWEFDPQAVVTLVAIHGQGGEIGPGAADRRHGIGDLVEARTRGNSSIVVVMVMFLSPD